MDALFLGNGQYQTSITVNPNQSGALVFPNVYAPTATLPNGTTNLMYAVNKWRQPYNQQATAALERRLTIDTDLTVNLIHGRGLKLWTADDQNLVAPTKTETYTIENASNQPASTYAINVYTAKNDPAKAHAYQFENGGSSWYDAVAVQLRKQLARTLSVQASYTWSHSIDDVSGTPIVPGVPANTNPGDSAGDRGNSPADQRHRGTVNWLWQPTVIKSNSPFARFLLNGWEVSGIATLASPQHRTPVLIAGSQQFSGITMTYTNSLNASGGWNRVPFSGCGHPEPGSNQYTVNGRLTRTLPFTERVKGMLMFEAFNVLNNQFTTAINTIGVYGDDRRGEAGGGSRHCPSPPTATRTDRARAAARSRSGWSSEGRGPGAGGQARDLRGAGGVGRRRKSSQKPQFGDQQLAACDKLNPIQEPILKSWTIGFGALKPRKG